MEPATNAAGPGKKTYYKFSINAKIALCKEVLHYFPYDKMKGQVTKAWEDVTQAFYLSEPNAKKIALARKSVKTQMDKMLESFKKQELESLRGSGEEEDFDELCQLLTDIQELKDGSSMILLIYLNCL